MTFAAVSISPDAAHTLHTRFRAVTGLRGELKGSRISLVERAYLMEMFVRIGARAWVAVADLPALIRHAAPQELDDLAVYTALLHRVIGQWQAESVQSPIEVMIDEGRYDPAKLAVVQSLIARGLGPMGRVMLADSKRSEGVQIADVIANSWYNIAAKSARSGRIATIMAPLVEAGVVRTLTLDRLP